MCGATHKKTASHRTKVRRMPPADRVLYSFIICQSRYHAMLIASLVVTISMHLYLEHQTPVYGSDCRALGLHHYATFCHIALVDLPLADYSIPMVFL
jgi:hypothetical protein